MFMYFSDYKEALSMTQAVKALTADILLYSPPMCSGQVMKPEEQSKYFANEWVNKKSNDRQESNHRVTEDPSNANTPYGL